MPFINTKGIGPMVLEIPPANGGQITGTIMDAWQAALEDVGPAGADKGKGGKYLILPPGYAEKIPDGSTRCCAPMSGAAMILMSPRRSPTRSRSSDTRCLKRPIRHRQPSALFLICVLQHQTPWVGPILSRDDPGQGWRTSCLGHQRKYK